jgi:hypothetical protein
MKLGSLCLVFVFLLVFWFDSLGQITNMWCAKSSLDSKKKTQVLLHLLVVDIRLFEIWVGLKLHCWTCL